MKRTLASAFLVAAMPCPAPAPAPTHRVSAQSGLGLQRGLATRTLRVAVTALALVAGSLATTTAGVAGGASNPVALYLHSRSPSGTVDQVRELRSQQDRGTYMDERAPTDEAPKISQTATGAAARPDVYGNALTAYWRGDVRGVVSGASATLWLSAAGSGAAFVYLFADGEDTPLAMARTEPVGATPTPVTVSFPKLTTPVGSQLLVQVLSASGRQLAVHYDSALTPSHVRFDLSPLPAGGPSAGIVPNLGKVVRNDDGTCDRADALCARATALKESSQVIIALVDTGANPYHLAYRREGMDVHPSEYVTGYPEDADAIVLSSGRPYSIARAADDIPVWRRLERNRLYWFPGTNLVGAISLHPEPGSVWDERPIIDDDGHGTGVTSVAAGAGARRDNGEPIGANPDALLVVVEGFGDAAVQWVRSQPWIDFLSASYGDPSALPPPAARDAEHVHTRRFVLEEGRTACFSAGNGLSRTGIPPDRWSSLRPTSGPSWVITVGAVSPRNEQDHWWHSVPVDVSSYGSRWPAASAFSADGEREFSGTSSATPITCGVFSTALLEARRALGDTAEGVHDGNPAGGTAVPTSRALADGVLTRVELQDAVLKTAEPTPADPGRLASDPTVMPTTPAYFTYQGYGIANRRSAAHAVDVLLGRRPMPDRSDVDAWIAAMDAVRDTFFPPA